MFLLNEMPYNRNSDSIVYMSPVTKKPVFGVFDQIRHKPTCAATEATLRLEISDIETRDDILSRQRTTKVLIRLLFAYGINRFSRDAAHSALNFNIHIAEV